jgi:hypothetical protein
MDIAEVQAFMETNKDLPEVKNYVNGFLTVDRVNGYLEGDDGKKILQPRLDTYHNKGLETWKTNNLNKMVDEEVTKRFPKADPRDVELGQVKSDLAAIKLDALRKDLTNKALKTAQDKKLPTDLIDFFVGNDEETTSKNLEKFIATMATHDEAIKTEFAKGNSYTPPAGDKSALVGDEKARAEIAKYMK